MRRSSWKLESRLEPRSSVLPVLPVHAQHRAQQHYGLQKIVVMNQPALAEGVAGIERPVAVGVCVA